MIVGRRVSARNQQTTQVLKTWFRPQNSNLSQTCFPVKYFIVSGFPIYLTTCTRIEYYLLGQFQASHNQSPV